MHSWRHWLRPWLGGALLLVLGWAPAAAQAIRGTVTDSANGRPLEGALVTLVGTGQRAATNASGEYTLAGVPAGPQTVRAQMIGYGPENRSVTVIQGEDAQVNFTLILKPIELEEIVSIGYGTVTRDNLTTAVSTISSEDILPLPMPAPMPRWPDGRRAFR